MKSNEPPVFVVGGTGRHGGTGAFVARKLLKAGVAVRSLARARDERATALEALGAKVVIGDLPDRRGLIPALADMGVAFFTYPIAGGIIEAAANFASAGRAAGLKRVVVMSMAPAHPESPSPWAGLNGLRKRYSTLSVYPAFICASPPCSSKTWSCCTVRIFWAMA